jgi:hypothetical protein
MAMIHDHPALFDGNCQSFIRHIIQVGRQQPPARLPPPENAPVSQILTLGPR